MIKTPSPLVQVDELPYARSASELLAHGRLKATHFVISPIEGLLLKKGTRKTLRKVWKNMGGQSYNAWRRYLVENPEARRVVTSLVTHVQQMMDMFDFFDSTCTQLFPFRRNTIILPNKEIISHLLPMLNIVNSLPIEISSNDPVDQIVDDMGNLLNIA